MADIEGEPTLGSRLTSAAPPPLARVGAALAIVIAGVLGGLIGYAIIDIGCETACTVRAGTVGIATAVLCALGVAVVAVLVLRAMGEWSATTGRNEPGARN